jgi:uncharacterized secreted protein with C-terminal beta-propeller domain
MSKRLASHVAGFLGAVTVFLALGGCPWSSTPADTEEGQPALRRFASGDELLNFFKDQAIERQRQNGGLSRLFGGAAAAPQAEDTAGGGATNGGDQDGESTSFSTTNLQEEGVDESDVVKSDGAHFYIAKGRTLRIVRAVPSTDMEEVASVELDAYIDSIYLFGSKVLVLGQKYSAADYPSGGPEVLIWPPYYASTTVLVAEVDVTDPGDPTVTGENELDGSLVSSRLTNGRLIVVLTVVPPLPENPTPLTIGLMSLDQVLPKMRMTGREEAPMVPVENWYRPASPDGYFTTAVVTLDAADVESVVGSVAIMANAGTIYASTEALYVTDSEYTPENQYRERTAVHKLAFNDQGVAEYVASGRVPGRLLNQFSLGEYEGYLRLATHVSDLGLFLGEGSAPGGGVAVSDAAAPTAADRAQGQNGEDTGDEPQTDTVDAQPLAAAVTEPYNAVYVLGETDGNLDVVGKIENIAPGEQLYAARFMGTRGFLVTFVQIDPLFVLDLSEPTKPAVAGQLKIPGYSDYLHPFGENLLIGVGRSTRETPWGGVVPDAVQLSLFDVSNLSHPTLIDQVEAGGYGSSTDVSYTHKAFTFLPDQGLLAIPGQLMSDTYDPFYGYLPEFDGAICFRVEPTGFTELGRVASVVYEDYWWPEWRRAAFIDDVLYAITPAGVRAADLDHFDQPTDLVLTPNEDEVGIGIGGGSSPGERGESVPSSGGTE